MTTQHLLQRLSPVLASAPAGIRARLQSCRKNALETRALAPVKTRRLQRIILSAIATLSLAGCGYHTAGHAARLPDNLQVLAVPVFTNQTQTYRIEQILSRQVIREFIGRTRYRVVPTDTDSADAKLQGTILTAVAAPLTYDAHTGRISSAVVTVTMKVTLTDRSGRVLFENQNYTFREQYQVSREVTSFFEEETPALERMSHEFARTLVSDILEAF